MDRPTRSGQEPYPTDLSGDFVGGIGYDSEKNDRENSGGIPVQPKDNPVIDDKWGTVTHKK